MIAKERILEQTDSENFRSMKYLKEEYNEFKITNPDLIKFIDNKKTYLRFVANVENMMSLKSYF